MNLVPGASADEDGSNSNFGGRENRIVCISSGKCVGYREERVRFPTSGVRETWEGNDNIIWGEPAIIDTIIEIIIRRPVPSTTVYIGTETAFYEYVEVFIEYQYMVENGRVTDRRDTGNSRDGEKVWVTSDIPARTRNKQKICVLGNCGIVRGGILF